MKHLLICTIGNRDIQFSKENIVSLPPDIQSMLTENTETDTMVVSKKNNNGQTFLTRSKEIFENYQLCDPYILYPLVQSAITNNGIPDKIILIPTDQRPNHLLDTPYVAEILKLKLTQDRKIPTLIRKIDDAKNSELILSTFQNIIKEHKSDYKIIINSSGGLPNFRILAFMASLFKEQVNVVNYIGSDNQQASVFNDYERHTLYHIIKNMLSNWNYSAILQLPGIPDAVQNLSRFAIARLALDLKKANDIVLQLTLNYPIPDLNDEIAIEKELMYSAYIKYHQKEFGDFLFRIFTFHDNMLKPHVEQILGGQFKYDKKSFHKQWHELLSRTENMDVLTYLKSAKVGNTPLNYDIPNKEAYYRIFHYCKKYSESRNLSQDQLKVMNLFKKLKNLTDLRNKIAHGYNGVNESMILKAANVSRIKDITTEIDQYLKIDFQKLGPYHEINENILELI